MSALTASSSSSSSSSGQSFALLDTAVVPLSSAHVWRRVGVLGGGQLGRMLAQAASRLGTPITVLDPTPLCPAGQITRQIVGSFTDRECIIELAKVVDIITVEIEHVNADILEEIEETMRIPVRPSPQTIRIIQDKFAQKQHLTAAHVPVGPYMSTPSIAHIERAAADYGYPFLLKSRRMAYDGRGNFVIKSPTDIDAAVKALGQSDATELALYAEKFVDFACELAVMVGRGVDGECAVYPAVVTNQLNNICHTVIAPAQIRGEYASRAEQFALKAIESLSGAGMFGVELFLLKDGNILVNEIAPRPHNSGHYTIEACACSQFEQHLRCILGLPLGLTSMVVGAATMINVLGTGNSPSDVERSWLPCKAALTVKGAAVHWYGKSGVSKGRKLGHITIVGDSAMSVQSLVKEWNDKLISFGADSKSLQAATMQHDRQILHSSPSPAPLVDEISVGDSNLKTLSPLVGIIMGSDSDLETMRAAAVILSDFDVPFELTIVSAHRTPRRMFEYAQSARRRGLRVIIAGAGGAAHLPGMVAALTPLPVIGVPIPQARLDGVDSLYSILQMPRGVPTATVAIGNATNAGLLAVRMLSVAVRHLADRMEEYQQRMEQEVLTKVDNMERDGWKQYSVAK